MSPNYRQIYNDILIENLPEKLKEKKIKSLLENLNTAKDIINLNNELFKNNKNLDANQKLRSYDTLTIKEILDYQKKHGFTNVYISQKYKISRNTIAKWKKIFV